MAAGLGRSRAGFPGMSCPRCYATVRHETLTSGEQTCPSCNGLFEAARFDPVEVRVVVPDIAGTGPETAAPCARHARNQAEAACARCGQFMCSLCRIDAERKSYCPSCFERLSTEGTLSGAVTRVKNYGGWAAISLLATFFCGFAAPITVSLAVYFCVRGLKDKRSRNETDGVFGLYLCLVFCAICLAFGGLMFAAMFGAFD